jgi:hypothetical protein
MPAQKQSAIRLVYRSGPSGCLGPQWDTIQVILQREDHGAMRTAASILLARNGSGVIIRKTDFLLDGWEQVTDEDALRACHEFFENRDRLMAEQVVVKARNCS